MAPTPRLSEINCGIHCGVTCLHCLACKAANIAHTLGFGWHEGFGQGGFFRALGHKNGGDRQIELARKFKIALVMGRAAENRARAIIHQNEIRDPNGQFPGRIKRVAHTQARITALFLGLFQGFGSCSTFAAVLAECRNLGVFCFECFGQGMIGGDTHKTGPHQRIRAGGVNINRAVTMRRCGQLKAELQPAGFADPIRLHQAHFFGPIV